MNQMIRLLMFGVITLAVAACYTPIGRTVRPTYSLTDVERCEFIRTISVFVSDAFAFRATGWGLNKSAGEKDVLVGARNQAGEMGGDRVIAVNEFSGDKQDFDVYKCKG